ncbi:GNAT family N-acetyltransferase [Janthinobacterium lividum]|uniref:GNAT family N-acetyltransferase n=1 Tax=Janthinobacterium lividum TaxID=29581 RepID=A0ABU0XRU3_9BURK|nr:GNAT family N-acetyltransferase [Janthinobacterium lividum]MDQ4626253.1 GNAT family N-acetyltransferase [Janthinobacterium lividum]MDQ4674780.1 GNAT family N-acetyltransferase [Janthinobacterium lividum]MDQ4685512.1 GNAT family N-acetyltransferase [Janthinobacterium lividum]
MESSKMVHAEGVTITLSTVASEALKALFWEVFFQSKNRGVTLQRHFPWLSAAPNDVIFAEARIGTVTVGGLVLREKQYPLGERTLRIAMIGLVCVAQRERGKGIANSMLEAIVAHAREQQFDYLTLWTSQYSVYEKHGFQVADRWMYGWVRGGEGNDQQPFEPDGNLVPDTSLPLPPFARAVYCYRDPVCSMVVLEDTHGAIVTAYDGLPAAAASAMVRHLPSCWRLNVLAQDAILHELQLHGRTLELAPVRLQMWLPLRDVLPVEQLLDHVTFPVLDRI